MLSFPLGANAISIAEAALVYQTIMTGNIYPFPDARTTGMFPLITKITDRKGETLWEYRPESKKILSHRVSELISNILRLAVDKGTGQGAKDAIQASRDGANKKAVISLQAYGKTGTSNNHTNSSFVGFIPGPGEQSRGLEKDEGYVIACYVGYDDNRPMKGRHVTIYGASGALPLWIETANTIVKSKNFRSSLQSDDLTHGLKSEPSWRTNGLSPVMISSTSGLPIGIFYEGNRSDDFPYVIADVEINGDNLEFRRVFEPVTRAFDHIKGHN